MQTSGDPLVVATICVLQTRLDHLQELRQQFSRGRQQVCQMVQ